MIISINEIVAEMQSILDEKGQNDFTLYVDHNTEELHDIKRGTTINKKILEFTKTVKGIITTSTGEVVALSGLFSTSFSFESRFYVATDKNIDNDLNVLISTLNGKLNSVDNSKYLITFNMPTVVGLTPLINGKNYVVVTMGGNIAITNGSMFGNELQVTLDDTIDLSGIMITADLAMLPTLTPSENTNQSLLPIKGYESVSNTIDLTLHLRKDTPLCMDLFKYTISPNLIKDKNFKITLSFNEYEDSWNCLLTGISTVFSIGGYVIMSVGFESVEVIS